MDIKQTLIKLFVSLLLSPIFVYLFLGIASMSGASYEMTHGETWSIWLLMAILINLSMTSKSS